MACGPSRRIRRGVTAGVALGILVPGWFASGGPSGELAVHAGGLVLGYVLPARGVEAPGDVIRGWRPLVVTFLLATLAWDAGTAAVTARGFLSEWWLVYSSGPAVLFALAALHGLTVRAIHRAVGGDRE